jgi:hypothetical protein
MITDYYFRVSNWAFGIPGEQIITVSSQVGNVFEIGREYTFSAIRLNSVFYDLYMVVSNAWIIDNSEVSEVELQELLNSVGRMRANSVMQTDIIEEAVATSEFVNNIDVAAVATVSHIHRRPDDFDNLSAMLDLVEVVHGEVSVGAFDEFIRLRGNVTVGGTYLILFRTDEYGHLRLLARNGAIIPYHETQFANFMNVLASAY